MKKGAMDDLVVFYVTNRDFLYPTLCSVISFREFVSIAEVDIYIFVSGVSPRTLEKLEMRLSSLNVTVVALPEQAYLRESNIDFQKTRFPPIALGRFGVSNYLPQRYKKLLYVDGDTLVVDQLRGLLSYWPERGGVAAVPEHLWMVESHNNRYWRKHSEYIRDLGIVNPIDYFNAGVFMIDADTWRMKSRQALDFFYSNNDKCLYIDQSALNHVFSGLLHRMCPLFNYTTEYHRVWSWNEVGAKILHFTGALKPWDTPRSIWGKKVYRMYQKIDTLEPWVARFRLSVSQSYLRNQIYAQRKRRVTEKIRLIRRYRARKHLRGFIMSACTPSV